MFPKTYRGPAEAMQPCQHGADGKARQPCTFPMPLPAKVSVIYRGLPTTCYVPIHTSWSFGEKSETVTSP